MYYDSRREKVNSFANPRSARTRDIANTALVVALAGLSKQWIQLVLFILGKTKIDAGPLKGLLRI